MHDGAIMQSPTLIKTALVGTTAGFDPPAVNFSSRALKHMFFDGLYCPYLRADQICRGSALDRGHASADNSLLILNVRSCSKNERLPPLQREMIKCDNRHCSKAASSR